MWKFSSLNFGKFEAEIRLRLFDLINSEGCVKLPSSSEWKQSTVILIIMVFIYLFHSNGLSAVDGLRPVFRDKKKKKKIGNLIDNVLYVYLQRQIS